MKALTPAGDDADLLLVNLGPSHPAAHGTLRTFVALDGETVAAAVCEMGYLHRGFEKMSEQGTWPQVLPYTDRLNYCSSLMNNVGFCKAVERLFAIELPPRCQALRVVASELARITDHLVCAGANLVDLGALTNFWYLFNPRERVYGIFEKMCGHRLTTSWTRIGGLCRDVPADFAAEVRAALDEIEAAVAEVRSLFERNRIAIGRTRDVAAIGVERALAWGWTGPCLRACGCPRDLRRDEPYYGYDRLDFEVVVGSAGDTYDRIVVRLLEIHESAKIIRQILDHLPEGPVDSDDVRVRLPAKAKVYHDMESLIHQFKLVYEGPRPPAGECYDATEAANGELGFFLVSDGGTRPLRVKVRPPCLTQYAAYAELVEGGQVADAVAALGSINIIAGELDR